MGSNRGKAVIPAASKLRVVSESTAVPEANSAVTVTVVRPAFSEMEV